MLHSFRGFLVLAALALCFVAQGQSYPPAWSSSSTYAVGDQVQLSGNIYRSLKAGSNENPTLAYSYWEAYYIRNAITVPVGAEMRCPTLTAAWGYIANARIAPAATVQILIITKYAAFNENFTAPVVLDHSDGSRISIIGDNAAQIHLAFNSTDGFVIDSGHSFGTISKVSLTAINPYHYALHFIGPGICKLLTSVYVAGFGTGIEADSGYILNLDSSVGINNCENALVADGNSLISCGSGLTIVGTGVLTSHGIECDYGSTVSAPGCNISKAGAAIYASFRSNVSVDNSTFNNNGTSIYAAGSSYVSVMNATVSNSSEYDAEITSVSTVYAPGTTMNNVFFPYSDGSQLITAG